MKEKLSMVSQLIELSKIDGHVSDQEIGFIQKVGNMIGLKNEEILELFKTPVEFDPPEEHFDRIVQFQRLVLLMNVDQVIDNSEIQHLRFAGLKMGLNPDAVNEVLKRIHDFPNNAIPPDELIKIYRSHMN